MSLFLSPATELIADVVIFTGELKSAAVLDG